jgi:two-component system, cell cycle sensor histidine kinase and response regulator CckA
MKMSAPLRLTAVWGPAFIVLFFGFIILVGVRRQADRAEVLRRSFALPAELEALVSRLWQAETTSRSFFLTGDSTYLEAYRAGPEAIDRALDSLGVLLVEPEQKARLDELAVSVRTRLAVVEDNIGALQAGQLVGPELNERLARGDRVMEDALALAASLREAQQNTLQRVTTNQARNQRRGVFIILIGTLTAAGLGLLMSMILSRYARGQEQAAKTIEHRNELLEEQAVELESQLEELQNQTVRLDSMREDLERAVDQLESVNEEMGLRERRFRSMVEHSGEVVTITDESGSIVYDSPSIERILGYSPTERIGSNVAEYVHPDDVGLLKDLAEPTPEEIRVTPLEFRVRDQAGSYRTFSATVVNLLEDPAVGGIVANLQDITELRATEERFRHAQKMEAVGRLAGGIAHDFNNLLMVIRGAGEIALLELPENTPIRSELEEIKFAADAAAALTRQLLAFSRQQVIELRVVNLNRVVGNVEMLLRRTLGADIEFVTRLAPNLGNVKVDAGQIEQILMNLSVNARDAMPTGGKLIIETEDVVIGPSFGEISEDEVAPGAYVLLSVSDSGIGMSKRVKERVFEPFFTTKPPGQGTGLGLSTVYGIVKQQRGYIWLYSEPGHGTTFKIYFPRVHESVTSLSEAGVGPIREVQSATILLVEDDPAVRRVTSRMLSRMGHIVLEARDAEEALSVAEEQNGRLDVVLTDVVLPTMGGPQLVQRIKDRWPWVRVLYASGYTNESVGRYGVLEGTSTFIQKPFRYDALAQKLATVLLE